MYESIKDFGPKITIPVNIITADKDDLTPAELIENYA